MLKETDVFFIDRLSRGAVTLATEAAALGAVVVFEPSAKSSGRLDEEAIGIAHIVKYAEARRHEFPEVMIEKSGAWVEVQTMGGTRTQVSPSVWQEMVGLAASRGSGGTAARGYLRGGRLVHGGVNR